MSKTWRQSLLFVVKIIPFSVSLVIADSSFLMANLQTIYCLKRMASLQTTCYLLPNTHFAIFINIMICLHSSWFDKIRSTAVLFLWITTWEGFHTNETNTPVWDARGSTYWMGNRRLSCPVWVCSHKCHNNRVPYSWWFIVADEDVGIS